MSEFRNTAVVEYRTEDGYATKVAFSKRNVGHAEKILADALADDGIDPSRVTRIYSELEPCDLPGAYCKSMIARRFPNAEVTYSFDYGVTRASRDAGKEALESALKERRLK